MTHPQDPDMSLSPAPQEFERYPALASWIERMANTGTALSLGEWMVFLGALNAALAAARSDPKPPVEGGGGEGMEASQSQPSGMGPLDHIGPQSQHSDGGRDV